MPCFRRFRGASAASVASVAEAGRWRQALLDAARGGGQDAGRGARRAEESGSKTRLQVIRLEQEPQPSNPILAVLFLVKFKEYLKAPNANE